MSYQHQSQYQPGAEAITRRAGCTWTSVANGIAATTGGRHHPSPDDIHDLLPRESETAPTTPGWSLTDATKAASRYGMTLVDHTGSGWEGVIAELAGNHYVLLQGDSDQFNGATCSGDFDGDHCIGIHPKSKVEAGVKYRWIDDPICPEGRWGRESVLRAYASKLWRTIRFAAFLGQVPPPQWQVNIPADTRFAIYEVAGDLITSTRFEKTVGAIERPCSAPQLYHWKSGMERRLVRIGGTGPRAGQYVNRRWAHAE